MSQIMMQIPAQKAISYPIIIGTNLLMNSDNWLPVDWKSKKLIIITDDNVSNLYGKMLSEALDSYNPLLLSFSPGEKSKNYLTKQHLEEQMIKHRCNREAIIVSLGGGVVGDMAGFIASTYMRGISYIQIPTTLLAMVDSSVGGKTGINTVQAKNMIGTFWQPACVVVDMNCLISLPKIHIINGFIEALKMFMTNDLNHFNYASDNIDKILRKDPLILKTIIEYAIKIKVAIVGHDEKENNERMVLNFGHTIGHALELLTDYNMLHGYAVAVGILVEAKISQLLGFLSDNEYKLIQSLLRKLEVSGHLLEKINIDELIYATKNDKKNKENNVRYVLLSKIGQVCKDGNIFAYPVSDEIVKKALYDVREVSNGG